MSTSQKTYGLPAAVTAELRDILADPNHPNLDSIIDSISEKYRLFSTDVDYAVCAILTEGTACEGCKFVTKFDTAYYPCGRCTRQPVQSWRTDCYESIET